jgi:hypothetical protein
MRVKSGAPGCKQASRYRNVGFDERSALTNRQTRLADAGARGACLGL